MPEILREGWREGRREREREERRKRGRGREREERGGEGGRKRGREEKRGREREGERLSPYKIKAKPEEGEEWRNSQTMWKETWAFPALEWGKRLESTSMTL